jgi:hypothetical protein
MSHIKKEKKKNIKEVKEKRKRKIKINRLANTFRWLEDPSTAWLVRSMAEDPA